MSNVHSNADVYLEAKATYETAKTNMDIAQRAKSAAETVLKDSREALRSSLPTGKSVIHKGYVFSRDVNGYFYVTKLDVES